MAAMSPDEAEVVRRVDAEDAALQSAWYGTSPSPTTTPATVAAAPESAVATMTRTAGMCRRKKPTAKMAPTMRAEDEGDPAFGVEVQPLEDADGQLVAQRSLRAG